MSTVEQIPNLTKIREWVDADGPEPEDGWDWPAPPEYVEYEIGGSLRADILARLNRSADDAGRLRLVSGVIEGGYSEYTVEHDYTIEVWLDEGQQSQRVFDHETYWHEDSLAAFLRWSTPTAEPGSPA